MRLVSWNLFGLESSELDERSEAAMFTVLLGDQPEKVLLSGRPPPDLPDLICLQEVVDRSRRAHIGPHLSRAGFELSSVETLRDYYELIAVRPPARIVEQCVDRMISQQGRELVRLVVEAEGRRWLILTGHLESMPPGSEQRCAQARRVLAELAAWEGPAVFAGDTNLRDNETTTLPIEVDAWRSCGALAEHRATYVSRKNGKGRRYDQIWGSGVRFEGFRTFGGAPVTSSGASASDHLGVSVDVFAEQS